MACTIDLFGVIEMAAPEGRIPDGMNVTAVAGPDTFQSLPCSPALAVGGFTLWPMSYE